MSNNLIRNENIFFLKKRVRDKGTVPSQGDRKDLRKKHHHQEEGMENNQEEKENSGN